MIYRRLGTSEVIVSALGFGAGQIGEAWLEEDRCGALLNEALNAGVTLFDTARGYGMSEERIGRHLSWRRKEIVISTKVGYGIAGQADWTYGCIIQGVDEALGRMRTDYLDVVHLHSCPKETLERGEVIEALEQCLRQGKVRLLGYSGENEALDFAVESGRFSVIECSVNLCDQRVMDGLLPKAKSRGMGVIGKRSLANAPWRFSERPVANYCETYWERLRDMDLPELGNTKEELAIRFSAFAEGVDSAIVGTSKLENILSCVKAAEKGPLDSGTYKLIRDRFREQDRNWVGQI